MTVALTAALTALSRPPRDLCTKNPPTFETLPPVKSESAMRENRCDRTFEVVFCTPTRSRVPRGCPPGNERLDADGVDSSSERGRRGTNLACHDAARPG